MTMMKLVLLMTNNMGRLVRLYKTLYLHLDVHVHLQYRTTRVEELNRKGLTYRDDDNQDDDIIDLTAIFRYVRKIKFELYE